MSALQFPCTIFRTQKWMDDYHASDMRCGDLSESELKTQFKLADVSARVNPYTLTKIPPRGQSGEGEKITRQQCAAIMFDEFRELSRAFAIYGPYRQLIGQMIAHMQKNTGTEFTDMWLNRALKDHIVNDRTNNSSLLKIQQALNEKIDFKNKQYPKNEKKDIRRAIMDSKLPKFDRIQDNINGMGIIVHDTRATHITIKSLSIDNDRYRAVVHYKVQDHFGLDHNDILKFKFHQFRFFRIWFVLQRYSALGFKPFMTNMEATVEVTGNRK